MVSSIAIGRCVCGQQRPISASGVQHSWRTLFAIVSGVSSDDQFKAGSIVKVALQLKWCMRGE